MNTASNGRTDPLTVGPELVNQLLALPADTREDLGRLLLDSVREDSSGLEEVERRERDEIRRRLERLDRGEEPTHDAFEVIARMREMLEERRRIEERYRP